jgi:hypothetical protein
MCPLNPKILTSEHTKSWLVAMAMRTDRAAVGGTIIVQDTVSFQVLQVYRVAPPFSPPHLDGFGASKLVMPVFLKKDLCPHMQFAWDRVHLMIVPGVMQKSLSQNSFLSCKMLVCDNHHFTADDLSIFMSDSGRL